MPGEFLTVNEVAEELGISTPTVYKLLRTKAIPAIQLGRQWRIRRSELYRIGQALGPAPTEAQRLRNVMNH